MYCNVLCVVCVCVCVCVHTGTQTSQLPAVSGLFMYVSLPQYVLYVCACPEEPLFHSMELFSDLLECIPVLAVNL